MVYKNDWEQARTRLEPFWHREIVDRCCCAVRATRDGSDPVGSDPPPRTHDELVYRWLDPEYNLSRMVRAMERSYYGGEAYPATTMCLGASVMAAFYGARVEYRPETVWYHPTIPDLAAAEWDVRIEEAPLYRETVDATRFYVDQCRGRYLVGLPELGSATDDLSLLRGMQDLVFDLLDAPDSAQRAIAALCNTWSRVHTTLFRIAQPCNDGGCCIPWMQTWAPGPHYQMSCDFSTVLSPELFRDFIVPELEAYLRVNEFSVYHLDGPDELKHLDTILDLADLKAVQWTPGDGQPGGGSAKWFPIYRRIQAADKALILVGVDPNDIEGLLGALSSRGLLVNSTLATQAEADSLLAGVARWTRE